MDEVKEIKFTRSAQPGNYAHQIEPIKERDITIYWKYENPNEKNDNVITDLLRKFGVEVANQLDLNNDESINDSNNPYIITDDKYNIELELYNKQNEKPQKIVYVIGDKYFTYNNNIDDMIRNTGNLINAITVSNNIETEETDATIYKKIKRPDSESLSQRFFDKIVLCLKDKETTKDKPYYITIVDWNSIPLPPAPAAAAPAAPAAAAPWWSFNMSSLLSKKKGGRKSNKKRDGSKKNKNKKKNKKSTQRK